MLRRLLTIIFFSTAAVFFAAAGWVLVENLPTGGGQVQRFKIPQGETMASMAQHLSDANLIRDPWLFRWFFRLQQEDGAFLSGTFSVPSGLSTWDTANFFRHAHPLVARVTVPEGWTASKIARLLEEKQVVPARAFLTVVNHPGMVGPLGQGLDTLEGRLFPDTYQFPLDSPAEEVAKTFLQTFQIRTSPWTNRYSPEELNQRIILASIVEREYRDPAEAPLIASVFSNRLEKGIPLGSCATIEYILTEIMGRPHPSRILIVHTEIPSPFNTYLHKGLPPGAIANPGLTALKAAFEPSDSDFLFFVVADAVKGTHTFSSNFTQHQKARENYLSSFVTKG